jgi:hypothetical protein
MNVTIIGNFDVSPKNVVPNFQDIEIWYDYFSGDSISVQDTQTAIHLDAGEFHIYTDKKLETPDILTNVHDEIVSVPKKYILAQNFPNPFNSETTIKYFLGSDLNVRLKIYNINGELVNELINTAQSAGEHRIIWNSRNISGEHVPSGIYFYRIEAGNRVQSRKMILIQ